MQPRIAKHNRALAMQNRRKFPFTSGKWRNEFQVDKNNNIATKHPPDTWERKMNGIISRA